MCEGLDFTPSKEGQGKGCTTWYGTTGGPEGLCQIRVLFLGTKRTPKFEQNKARYRKMLHSAESYKQTYGYFSSPVYLETGWEVGGGVGVLEGAWLGMAGRLAWLHSAEFLLLAGTFFAQITMTSDVIEAGNMRAARQMPPSSLAKLNR